MEKGKNTGEEEESGTLGEFDSASARAGDAGGGGSVRHSILAIGHNDYHWQIDGAATPTGDTFH